MVTYFQLFIRLRSRYFIFQGDTVKWNNDADVEYIQSGSQYTVLMKDNGIRMRIGPGVLVVSVPAEIDLSANTGICGPNDVLDESNDIAETLQRANY